VSGRPALVALLATLSLAALAPASALEQPAAPIVPPGTRLGDAAPASLVQPSTFQASFRVPPQTDLAVATIWLTRTLTVTLTYPDGRRATLVGAPTLPGATLGVVLPNDAWRATRIDLTGTTVSRAGVPLLVTGAQLAYGGASDWWHIAAFGLLLGVTLLGALLAVRRRTRALTSLALFAGAQTVLAIPYLGVLRPPPEISQPVHALAFALAWSALAALVLDRAAAAQPPRPLRVALLTLLGANVVFVLGRIAGSTTRRSPFWSDVRCSRRLIWLWSRSPSARCSPAWRARGSCSSRPLRSRSVRCSASRSTRMRRRQR